MGGLPFPSHAFDHLCSPGFDHGHRHLLGLGLVGGLHGPWIAGLAPVVAALLHDVHLVAPFGDGAGQLQVEAGA